MRFEGNGGHKPSRRHMTAKAAQRRPTPIPVINGLPLCWNTSSKLPTSPIPCNTGIFIESGTNACFGNYTLRTRLAVWERILKNFGMKASSAFLTITLSHWPRNWPSVACLASVAMNVSNLSFGCSSSDLVFIGSDVIPSILLSSFSRASHPSSSFLQT